MPTTLLKNPVDVTVASAAVGLNVTGTAAAAATGAGAKPSNTLTVTGTPGQATTGTGVAAGAGADVVIAAGVGGAAVTGATRGSGGSVTINPGAPATGAGTGGAYGNVLLATTGGFVGVGTTTPNSAVDITGTATRMLSATRLGNASASSTVNMRKAGAGTTAVSNGHEIGNLAFAGYDGTSYVPGARIRTVVDGAVSTGVVPMALALSTGGALFELEEDGLPEGPNVVTERLRVTSDGNLGINTETPTSKLHVDGGVQVGNPTGGDHGTGTINVSGGYFINGASVADQLAEARQLITELTARADRLEAELQRLGGKGR